MSQEDLCFRFATRSGLNSLPNSDKLCSVKHADYLANSLDPAQARQNIEEITIQTD